MAVRNDRPPDHGLAQREGDRVGRLEDFAWQPRAYVSLLDIAILGDPVLTHVAPDYLARTTTLQHNALANASLCPKNLVARYLRHV